MQTTVPPTSPSTMTSYHRWCHQYDLNRHYCPMNLVRYNVRLGGDKRGYPPPSPQHAPFHLPVFLPFHSDTKQNLSELYFVVPAVIIFICIIVALLVGMVLFVRHHRRKTRSSSSRGPQTSAFSRMVPTDPLLPSLTPSSPTCPSSSSPNVKLIKLIGRGRFGAVWKAELAGNETTVAAKVFTYHSRHSWENESRLYSMQSTSHPNILQYLGSHTSGAGGHDAQMYVFAPYYELGSLAHFLREAPPLTWAQMCNVLRCVVGGVAHLHSECYTNAAGLVVQKYAIAHRDVKSANILMRSAEGDCVVGDLGLALVLDPTMDPKQMANSGQVHREGEGVWRRGGVHVCGSLCCIYTRTHVHVCTCIHLLCIHIHTCTCDPHVTYMYTTLLPVQVCIQYTSCTYFFTHSVQAVYSVCSYVT